MVWLQLVVIYRRRIVVWLQLVVIYRRRIVVWLQLVVIYRRRIVMIIFTYNNKNIQRHPIYERKPYIIASRETLFAMWRT